MHFPKHLLSAGASMCGRHFCFPSCRSLACSAIAKGVVASSAIVSASKQGCSAAVGAAVLVVETYAQIQFATKLSSEILVDCVAEYQNRAHDMGTSRVVVAVKAQDAPNATVNVTKC